MMIRALLLTVALLSAVSGSPVTSNSTEIIEFHKKHTKNPPVYSPFDRKNRTLVIENDVHIYHPNVSTVEPDDFLPIERINRTELNFWKKVKHALDKGLKKVGDKVIDGIAGAIAGGVVG